VASRPSLAALGEAHTTRSAADALARYGEALALATELRMRLLIAHCHLGLGKLYWCTGKREQAREHFTTAGPQCTGIWE
jgi:hypothetical protein